LFDVGFLLIQHGQLTNKTPPNNVDMVDVVTEVAGQDKVQVTYTLIH
jgi:hypothetical protein